MKPSSAANETLKQKRARVRKYIHKSVIVIISGEILALVCLALLYLIIEVTAVMSSVCHNIIKLIVYPNAFYAMPLLHPIVYGLYLNKSVSQ